MNKINPSFRAPVIELSQARQTGPDRRHLLCIGLIALLSVVGSGRLATAAPIYWDGSVNPGAWGTASNWSTASGATTPDPGAAPTTGDIAQFNISTVNTAQTVNLNAPQSADGLVFSSTGTVLLQGGGVAAQTLNLGTSGITVNSGAGVMTIGSTSNALQGVNITLGDASAANFNIINNSGSQFNLAGKITGFAGAAKTLTFGGTGIINIANGSGGVNQQGGILNTGSSLAVVMNGAGGTLMMGGNGGINNYTGGTRINAGTFQVIGTPNLPNASALFIADGTTFSALNNVPKAWTGMTQQWNGDFRYLGNGFTMTSNSGTVNLGAIGTDTTRSISVSTLSLTIGDVITDGTNGITKNLHVNGTLTLSGNNLYTGATTVANGTLNLSGNNAYAGANTVTNGTLSIIGTNASTGSTTINSGSLSLSGNGTLAAPTAYAFNGGSNLTLTNTTPAQAALVRVNSAAPIAINGNTSINYTNTSGNTYSQSLGDVTLTGQLNAVLTNNMAAGSQLLTMTSLTRATPTSTVTFSAGVTGPNATSNRIIVGGGGTTAAGQIVGPWATVGTTAALQTDYAVYNSGEVGAAGIANSAEGTWTGGATGNYTSTSTANSLTGNRAMNSWRYSAAAGALTLGANNFDTNGILNGGTGLLTISAAGGALRQQGTAAGNLFVNAGNNSITISAPIQNNTGALTLVKSGSGTLSLSNANNTFSGGVVLNSGTLSLNDTLPSDALGTGTLTINGGALTSTTASWTNANNNSMIWNGDFDAASTQSSGMNMGTGSVTLSNIVKFTATGGRGFVVGGTISGSGGLIIAGNINMTNTGTFTGNTMVTATGNNGVVLGALTLQNSAFDTSGGLFPTSFSGAATVQLGGILGPTNWAMLAATQTLQLNLGTGVTHKYSGALSGGTTMAVTKAGLGTQIFAGENTYTGATTINAGTLSIKTIQDAGSITPNALGRPAIGANSIIGLASNATLQYTGFMSGSSNRVVNLTTASGGTFALDASGSTPFALSGGIATAGTTGVSTLVLTGTGVGSESGTIVDGTGANITALTKNGTGTWTLSGNNTYTGNTAINQGILALLHGSNNNIADSPLITLASTAILDTFGLAGTTDLILANGQTLKGTGTVVGNLTVGPGSTIAPGNSPGTLVHIGDETWDILGAYEFEINDVGAANPVPTGTTGNDPGWDLLDISGTLAITATSSDPFAIELVGLTLGNAVGIVNDFNNTASYAWMIADATSNVVGYASDKFVIDDSQFVSFNPYGGTFSVVLGSSVGGDDSQVWLTYSNAVVTVPEPSSLAFALLGLAGLGLVAWRKRRRS